jgi:hypothetical protein
LRDLKDLKEDLGVDRLRRIRKGEISNRGDDVLESDVSDVNRRETGFERAC